jgi:hypothetical protein
MFPASLYHAFAGYRSQTDQTPATVFSRDAVPDGTSSFVPFEIDAELEAAFDQMQEEQEITGNIRPGWG